MGSCHACNGSHLVKDCEESICKRCKPNLDNHTPVRYPRKRPPKRQQKSNPSYTNNSNRDQSNGHNDPSLQLSVSTSKPDHIADLLEATGKVTRYFKKSHKHNNQTNTDSHHPLQTTTMQFTQINRNVSHITLVIKLMKLLEKHVHVQTQNQNLKILQTSMTQTVLTATMTLHQT